MIIWWSIFFNLIALQVENTVMRLLNLDEEFKSELWSYALNSIACFFFCNALMLQTFEWDLLGSMIIFQAKHRVSELNVVRDTFIKEERRKWRWTIYIIWVNVAYHLIKVIIPTSTLISCYYTGIDDTECGNITEHRIRLMLYCDCTYACLLYNYEIYTIVRLIIYSWKKSRLEAKAHMSYFVLNSLGMLLALPLIINGLVSFIRNYDEYEWKRWVYYQDYFAKMLPSLIYICTKKNEDCFKCFNRLAPQTYSIIQYSTKDLRSCSSVK